MAGWGGAKRCLTGLLVCALALGLFSPAARADTPASAPLTAGATANGMVRVRLSSLGAPAALNLTVYGSYTVNGQTEKTLSSGSAVTVKYSAASGTLSLTAGGVTTNMGSSFKLRRHAAGGQNGVKISQSRVPGNLYPGDFQFTVKNGVYYIIAYIYMEDYLYGVLPYEMGSSSPLEALKAQAIAARTYTMRAMKNASSSLYDVVDTTSDQVYNGTPSSSSACTRAVDATKGIALKYGDSFAATYYTASNGGQTESIKNAWGTNGYPYLSVKDDPYDLNSPEARKASFFVSASGAQSNAALQSLLNQKAAAAFGSGASITAVTAVTPHTPKYPSPSKLYTKLDFAVAYTRNGASGLGVITFNVFSELEAPLGMSINSGANELWSVTSAVGGFTVTARRYGHGLGMSQRGAMQMAKQGYSCAQILGFYFEGCTQVQHTLTRSILSPAVSGQPSQEQLFTEAPAPIETAAPADTPAPTQAPATDALYARVTTAQGSLNLRENPRSTARVLRTIPQYETIPVLEKGDSWCRVSYGGFTGYVMTAFLTFPGNDPAPTPTAAPTQAPATDALYARVTTAQGSLNLRESPRSTARVLRTIPQYETIPVLEKGDSWCRVSYGGFTGYVMTAFLTFPGNDPAPTPTAAPTQAPATDALYARVTTAQGSLNLRENPRSTARVLRTIPQYETIPILEKGSAWCRTSYGGYTGYVMTAFLTFPGNAPAPTAVPAPLPTAAPTQAPASGGDLIARVVTAQGSLNLREAPRSTARVLRTIPQYDFVTVHEKGASWCRVTYAGVTGYVMTGFLSFNPVSPLPSAPVSQPTAAPTRAPIAAGGISAQVTTAQGSLNLRENPRDTARVLTTIPQYAYVAVSERGAVWCRVTYGGFTGWAMTRFLSFAGNNAVPSSPAATAAPAPSSAVQRDPTLRTLQTPVLGRIMPTDNRLNLRTGCSADADILLEMPKYDFLLITAAGDTWCEVEYEGRHGFCMTKYLEYQLYE